MNQKVAMATRIVLALGTAAYFFYYAQTPMDWHFIDNVNLIIHEAGHSIFAFFGDFLHILGGSLLQIAIPVIFSGYFFLRGQYYSGSLLLFWVGQNFINVSVYAADAVVMQLPLLGGDNAGHDWNNLLSMTHALPYTHAIATALFTAGFVTMCAAAALSLYFGCVSPAEKRRASY